MKKFLTTICAVLAFSFIFCTGTTTEAKTTAYTETISKNYTVSWSNGTKKFYTKKANEELYKLYCKNLKTGKTQLLKKLAAEKDSDESYSVSYVYGNKVYLSSIRGAGDGDTYIYNMKTKTYKLLKKNFIILSASGKNLVASMYMPTDISPYPTYVYQITFNGVKKIKKLGNNTSTATFVNGKIYYASYPAPTEDGVDAMNCVNVYQCNKDGSAKKKIFTQKADGKNNYIIVQAITDNTIVYSISSDEGNTEYQYNRTTGKTEEVTEK